MKDGFQHRYWVYIVASATGTLYTGLTGDLYKRIMQHKNGEFEGFSRQYKCTRLVYHEGFDQAEKMIQREKQIKSWRREKKIALIGKRTRDGKIWRKIGAANSCCQGKALTRKLPEQAR